MRRAFLALLPCLGACSDDPAPAAGAGPGAADAPVEALRPEPRLLTRRQRPLDAKPEHVAAADLDGDGFEELLATTIAPGALLVWRGSAAGLERAPRALPIGAYPLRPVPLAPDAAGRRLVAVASRADRTLAVVDALGDAAPVTVALDTVPRALAAGDLGADGTEELVLALDGRRLVAVRGGAVVSEAALPGDLPRCALVASDGRGVVVGLQATRALAAVRWEDGALGALAHDVAVGGIPRALVEADLDADGDPELAYVAGDHTVGAFGLGDPSGVGAWFGDGAPAPRTWRTGAVPIDLLAADLDGRPGDELGVLTFVGLSVEVLDGFGADRVARQEVYAGQTPPAFARLDATGDGVPDVAVANRDSIALSLIPGTGGGRLGAPVHTAVGGFPSGLVAADFTGDGAPDVLAVDAKDGTVSVCPNDGGALGARRASPVGPAPRAARAADLDGDGALDVALVVVDGAGARLVRRFGDGTGALRPRAAAPDVAVGAVARDLLVADATGDGALDFVLVDDEGDRLALVGGDPAGGLALRHEAPLASGPAALVALELDGDAGCELAVALGGAGAGRGIALVDPAGPDGAPAPRELARLDPGGSPFDLALGDLDGDGAPDLVALGADGPDGSPGTLWAVRVERDGDAARLVGLGAAPTALAPRGVTVGDLDGDGRDEVLVAAQFSHVVNLFRATEGAGFALEALDDVGAGIGPMAVALADVDGDGAPDVVVANGHSDDVCVIRQAR